LYDIFQFKKLTAYNKNILIVFNLEFRSEILDMREKLQEYNEIYGKAPTEIYGKI
jgi:hypothetical protein